MKTDVAIVGGGPGGSAAAIRLRRLGIDATLIEREPFPRFHIGESMTGECGAQVRSLGLEEQMARYAYPVKYGTAVYGANGKNRFYVPVMRRLEDWTREPATTWQVRRSTFDEMVQEAALDAGAGLVRGKATAPIVADDGTVTGVRVKHNGSETEEDIHAEVVLDTSGQGKFLAHAGVTSPIVLGRYFRQAAFFTHVRGALRDEGDHPLDTVIFYKQTHHWAWFIPIDDEVTSIGVVVPADYFRSFKESPQDFFLREVHEVNPELTRRIAEIERVEEVRTVANYSYRVEDFTGPGYLCAGDSHRFIDPIFSFGLFVALAESEFASDAIAGYLDGQERDAADPFAAYRAHCELGLERFQTLIDGFWSNPLAFALLVHRRYTEDFIDLFAGRVYDDEDNRGVIALREINERAFAEGRFDAVALPGQDVIGEELAIVGS